MAANHLDSPYHEDGLSKQLDAAFSQLFDRDVKAMWVATGTAANCLALAALCPSHKGVICHKDAHIEQDECGAPGFYTGGAKLMLLGGDGAKLLPSTVSAHVKSIRDDVHQVQPAALSITNATEYGLVYSPSEVQALSDICKSHGMGLHMDGARFANALVSQTGVSAADLTWRAGVDVLSFGCVKNGGLNGEALIFFNEDLAKETEYRRKRAGHLQSKGRFLAAQILAMLKDDLWLKNARAANAGAALIAQAAGDRLVHPVQANEVFLKLSADEAAKLRSAGFDFYDWGVGEARFVTSWDQGAEQVAPLAAAISAL